MRPRHFRPLAKSKHLDRTQCFIFFWNYAWMMLQNTFALASIMAWFADAICVIASLARLAVCVTLCQ